MNSNLPHELTDAELDAGLARLPQWQPPQDFAARLAAAAAQQAEQPAAVAPSAFAFLLDCIGQRLPLVVGGGVLALVLAWLPWTTVVGSSALPWLVAGSSVVLGLVLTLRLLRAP